MTGQQKRISGFPRPLVTRAAFVGGLIIWCSFASTAFAAGTRSGTMIYNTATAMYDIGANKGLKASVTSSLTVDNKVALTVTKNGDATVKPGSSNNALVFRITNHGNTPQRYELSATNAAGIVMNNVRIYLDNGTTPNEWDTADTLYVNAGTFGDVPPDGFLNVLIVADTPGSATEGQSADYHLIATTVDTGTLNVTAQTIGPRTPGVNVVFADMSGSAPGDISRDGRHSATGRFSVNSAKVLIAKSVIAYSDPIVGIINGTPPLYADCTACPRAMKGAVLRYSLAITVSGNGTAGNTVITDPIPTGTAYNSGSLKLNGAILSDPADSDAGEVTGSPTTVKVKLGNLTNSSTTQTINFDVTIN